MVLLLDGESCPGLKCLTLYLTKLVIGRMYSITSVGSSPVAGFEDTAESFVSEMREATVTVVTTGDAEKIISESKRGKSPASSGACSNICSIV